MKVEPRYALNTEAVAAKVIEGEAIVINVVTGRYYSFEGPSAVAWTQLSAGATVAATADAIVGRYAVDAPTARGHVAALVEQLLASDLLVLDGATVGNGTTAAAALDALGEAPAAPLPYAPVALTAFDDMEDLLAFDPPLPAPELPDGPWSPG
jgi:hypothetical protein